METNEALNIVAQLIALAPVNLQAHQAGQQALKVLQEALTPKEEKKK
jgi:hypothetical protein